VWEAPKPSAYTPLLRRFTNERARELKEIAALYEYVSTSQAALSETPTTFARRIYPHVSHLPDPIADPLVDALCMLILGEQYIWELPPPDFERMDMREFVEYRNFLHHKQYFFANQAALFALLEEGLTRIASGIAQCHPPLDTPSPFTIPLISGVADPNLLLDGIIGLFAEDAYRDAWLFKPIHDQLYRNVARASGFYEQADPARFKMPSAQSLPLHEKVAAYFADTPFEDVLLAPVPLTLSHEARFNHMHVLAGSGVGKTVLIENLIRHDLAAPDPPSLILIDPHSDLVRKLMRSDMGIEDRLIHIDPRDTKYPVALNPFAINQERFSAYDEVTREQVTAGVIQTFGYLWNGLTNLALTGKQEVFFRYVTRLLLTLPSVVGRNATILDMLKLMQDPTPYARAIEQLPDIQRDFFERDFKTKVFEQTREQIRYRLQAIIENPTIARLFMATETKVDFFTEMNRGAVILVDTAKDFLKDGSAVFGKLMISLVLQAVLERAAIPEQERKPTFLMVDEAGTFFSNNIDDLLTEARKYKCGILLAHQHLDQSTASLRASLAANTGIKFASGLSAADASAMARDMRTTPDFILSQPKLQFAAHIRHVTSSAVSVPIRPVESPAWLSDAAYAEGIARNRARVSLARPEGANEAVKPLPPPNAPQPPPDDISAEW
jgi:hypothetical protein